MSEVPEKLSALQRGCTRSHPHEDMDYECELKTVIAKMMNENKRKGLANAPKKIWVRELPRKEDGVLIGLSYHTEPEGLVGETETPYIRADIVDELVEALKWMTAILVVETETDVKAIDRAEAALAKLEESHE